MNKWDIWAFTGAHCTCTTEAEGLCEVCKEKKARDEAESFLEDQRMEEHYERKYGKAGSDD